jgi:hypothetical protein
MIRGEMQEKITKISSESEEYGETLAVRQFWTARQLIPERLYLTAVG